MQQKTKFIICIALIYFIFFLFLPVKTWSVYDSSAGGGGSCIEVCARMEYETVDYGYGPFDRYYCVEWYPLPPECFATTTTKEEEEEEKITYSYKHCGAGCGADQCLTYQTNNPNQPNLCETDADCSNGTPPPNNGTPPPASPSPTSPSPTSPQGTSPPYDPGTGPSEQAPSGGSTRYYCNPTYGLCFPHDNGSYTSLSICQANCYKASPPPAGPPPTSPPAPKCGIIEFSINGKTNEERDPLLVWVNASLKGRISTNTDCTKCTVESTDTWGNDPDPVEYAINFANNYNAYETFKIPESGTYSFTVTCQGSDPEDIVVNTISLKTVQAINLPWWREIIPVLRGFLGGIFR